MSYSTVFFGTSEFAVPILKRLHEDERFDVKAVVTQPDRPVGRKQELLPSPVKTEAERLGLPILQFDSVKTPDALEALMALDADIFVVASFGQIIPKGMLDLPAHGSINVHASLLPKYRGASPISGAILEGEKETGVSIMLMDEKMDHGPVLATAVERIKPDDTTESLSKRLAELGAGMLPDAIDQYAKKEIAPVEQDHDAATYVPILMREHGRIDWNQPANRIERMVRAYTPWPGTFFDLDGKRLKVLKAAVGASTDLATGARTTADQYPSVACGDGMLLKLLEVQMEGKKAVSGDEFLKGASRW